MALIECEGLSHVYLKGTPLETVALSDVTLAIEPMHPACASEWTFLTDVESTITLIDSYDSPNLKMVFDTYHFGHDQSLLANMRELVPYFALVQLGDRRIPHGIDQDRCPVGLGVVPLQRITEEILEAGYTGDFEFELMGQDFECCDYQQLLNRSRAMFDSWTLSASAN